MEKTKYLSKAGFLIITEMKSVVKKNTEWM